MSPRVARIAQVCARYYPYVGGVETHVKEISERLCRMGHEVEVLTTDPSGSLVQEELVDNVRVRRFKCWAPRELFSVCEGLRKYLAERSGEYDVVHAHNYHDLPAFYVAQSKSRNRMVFTPHYHGIGRNLLTSFLHVPYLCAGRMIFDKTDRVICVSQYEKDLVLRRFGIDERKVVVIPNGVDLNEFRPSLGREAKGWRMLLYVGRLQPYKGVRYLIEVLQMLDDDVVLEIVGQGPEKQALVNLANRLGVRSRVRFDQALSREQLVHRYAQADVLVLLSRTEAYGLCVAEAMATGTPCVVANTSALKEWIDERNCFGVRYPIDLQELADAIMKAFGRTVDRVLSDWDEVASRVANTYGELLAWS
jgi:glycosyltransferase involved in cell wall biosynthesis